MSRTSLTKLFTKNFSVFFAGRTVDLAGSAMTPIALSLSVLAKTNNVSHAGLVMAANVLPSVIFLLAGGIFADRVSRSRLLSLSCLVCALTQSILCALLAYGHFDLTLFSIISAITGIASGFGSPALRGIVPEFVAKEQVQEANALLGTVQSATRILSPTLAATLVASSHGSVALGVDAASYLIAAFCFSRLPKESHAQKRQGIGKDLIEGFFAFVHCSWVWPISLAYAYINFMLIGPWQILGAYVVGDNFGYTSWGLLQSIRAAAILLANALMLKVHYKNPLVKGLMLGSLLGLPLICLGLQANMYIQIAAVIVGALGFQMIVIYNTALQRHIPADTLSRVSAIDDSLAFISVPLSQATIGFMSDNFGANNYLIVAGISIVMAHFLPLLSASVRHVTEAD